MLKTVSDKKSQCKATIQEMEQAAAAEERKIGSPVAAPTQSLISAVVAPNQRALSSPYRQGGNASASASAAVNSSIFAAHNAATVPYSRDFSSLVAAASSGAPYPTLDTAFTSSRAAASLGAGVSLSGNLLQTALLDQQRRQQDLQLQQEIHLLGLRQQQQQDLRDFEQRQYLRQQVQQRLHQELLLQHREQEEIQLLHRKQELARQVAMQRQALDLLQSRQRLGAPTESHSQALASSREELERLVQQQQAVIDELLLREAARRRRSGGSS